MWIYLTAGRGPGECQIAISHLTSILLDEANDLSIDAALLDTQDGPHGLLSALVVLDGDTAETLAASWEGTIKWICPSPIRKNWGRKNWFISASVIRPPASTAEFRESDLRFEAYRSSGPGGQHVNKTNSAIRVTHLPTGLVAQAQEERSQHRNKALAVARLAAMLANRKAATEQAVEHEKWSKHDALERGNPIRTYRGPGFTRS